MLEIRAQQIDIFENVASANFEHRLVDHLMEAFPKHCIFLGTSGVCEVVRDGIERSRFYGFIRQSSVSLFIELTMLLGRFFDVDVQMPWALEILSNTSFKDELTKAQRLHAASIEYLGAVSGPDNEFIDAAQNRVLHEPVDIKCGSVTGFTNDVLIRLERIWPEKCGHLGDKCLRSLIRVGISGASTYNIRSESGVLVYIGLMYMLGSGFDRDPLFSWAHRALKNSEEQDETMRIDNLHLEAINYLRQWCV